MSRFTPGASQASQQLFVSSMMSQATLFEPIPSAHRGEGSGEGLGRDVHNKRPVGCQGFGLPVLVPDAGQEAGGGVMADGRVAPDLYTAAGPG